jgi:hypothetical protein
MPPKDLTVELADGFDRLDGGDRLFGRGNGSFRYAIYRALFGNLFNSITLITPSKALTATYQRFPIRDISVPIDAEYLAEILLAIDRRIRQGGAVYMHWRGGVGRTGLVVACWLQERGRTPDAALGELSAKWKTVKKSLW